VGGWFCALGILRRSKCRQSPAKSGDFNIDGQGSRRDADCVAVDAVCCEPFSPKQGNQQGKYPSPPVGVERIPKQRALELSTSDQPQQTEQGTTGNSWASTAVDPGRSCKPAAKRQGVRFSSSSSEELGEELHYALYGGWDGPGRDSEATRSRDCAVRAVGNLLREDEGPQRRGRPAVSSKATSFNAAKFEERPKKRRTMSAAGRARIMAAQKKRWARRHREEKRAAGAPAKKTAASKQAKRPAPARKAAAEKEWSVTGGLSMY
jgi:hypothetical protein